MSQTASSANLEFARQLLEHSFWEDERVWRLAIAPLSDEQFTREVGFGMGSMQRLCLRLMEAQSLCLRRIVGDSHLHAPSGETRHDRTAIWTRWRAIHEDWAACLSEPDDDRFFRDCALNDGPGGVTLKAWQLMLDLVYHGAAQRADMMRVAAEVHEPPDFDLSLMQYLTGVFRQ